MFKSGYILDTNEKLVAAIHNQSMVTVWMHDEILDYGGIIEEFNDYCIKINNEYFVRANCVFKIT
jgi:hypothetical protein